ncbi:MAG: uracil phosphoribosyltransferase [Planctomycetes bacterium]|nr:uracil phosphoribosyltransferase [Planctomycetota bacterium]
MPDTATESLPANANQGAASEGPEIGLDHGYGPRVHILEDAWTAAATAKLSSPDCTHTELVQVVRALTTRLATTAFGRELPTSERSVSTRMAEKHGELGTWRGEALDPAAEVVVLDVIRGGIIPSQTCFELLSLVHPIERLRLDHLNMQRVAGEDGRVDRVELTGSKVGGSIEGSTLVIPDPMGATGGTILRALEHLKAAHGMPSRLILIPLICTPEFLRAVQTLDMDLSVYTARVDRGMSDRDVLASPLGARWTEERGLDDEDYIVPGAGGVGEVLNHSWA